jgi:ParB family chromosome partitioning protein
MARRNIFQPPPPPEDAAAPNAAQQTPDQKTRFPNTGAMSGIKSTLKDLSSNAVKDIPVDDIEEAGPKDRLGFTEADVVSLAESIKSHGQQVPIMVRPLPNAPGKFQVVYGRRRLRALRSLGLTAKALVRSLSDEEAILAQGQENSQRLDPSFIEKALFAAELMNDGYKQTVIIDALAIDKPMLSRMTKVARSIPQDVIQIIGSAHGVGRRRWEELANNARNHNLDMDSIAASVQTRMPATSEERFTRISEAVSAALKDPEVSPPAALPIRPITLQDGTVLAEVKETARALSLKLSKTGTPEFTQWMQDNAETELKRLYEAWQSNKSSD